MRSESKQQSYLCLPPRRVSSALRTGLLPEPTTNLRLRYVGITVVDLGFLLVYLFWTIQQVLPRVIRKLWDVTYLAFHPPLISGALEEIAYTLDVLEAQGVALTSSYGENRSASKSRQGSLTCLLTPATEYIGDDQYNPVWDELNRRKAVVFLHGAQTASSTPYPHPFLGIPITEVSSASRITSIQPDLFPPRRYLMRLSKLLPILWSQARSAGIPASRLFSPTWAELHRSLLLASQSYPITWDVRCPLKKFWRTSEASTTRQH